MQAQVDSLLHQHVPEHLNQPHHSEQQAISSHHPSNQTSSRVDGSPCSAVCLTTAGSAMLRRARFRRAVSGAPASHHSAAHSDQTTPPPAPPHKTPALPEATPSFSPPLAHPSAHTACGIAPENHVAQQGGGSPGCPDSEAVSISAEAGSELRDSTAMSLPEDSSTLLPSHHAAVSQVAEQGNSEKYYSSSNAGFQRQAASALVGSCAAPEHVQECLVSVSAAVPHCEAVSLTPTSPKRGEAVTPAHAEVAHPQSSMQEFVAMREALEASQAQNAQLRASLAAMRAEIELLQRSQTHPITHISAQQTVDIQRDVSPIVQALPEQRIQSIHDDPGDRAVNVSVPTAADRDTAAESDTAPQATSREASGMYDAMLQLLSREHELCAPSDRENSGPFSSMHDASNRAASLHAAIMAATGGAVSMHHALECALGGTQHAQRCDAGVQVPETLEPDEQLQLVRFMLYSLFGSRFLHGVQCFHVYWRIDVCPV
jgi:hypothetical protein